MSQTNLRCCNPPPARRWPCEGVTARGAVRGLLFELTVEQRYRNPGTKNVEAVYTFPLPFDAVLLDLDVEIERPQARGRGGREEGGRRALREGDRPGRQRDHARARRRRPVHAEPRQPDGGRVGDDPLPLRAAAALRARQRAHRGADGDRAALRRSRRGRARAAPGAGDRPRGRVPVRAFDRPRRRHRGGRARLALARDRHHSGRRRACG